MDPTRDRARFLTELIRLVHTPRAGRNLAVETLVGRAPAPGAPAPAEPLPRVPVPLTAAIWSDAILKTPVTSDQLVQAIVSDRRAALLAYALAALDDETLTFLADHPAILTQLFARGAPPFAAFGASLRIRGGRVMPPGGDVALPLWESVVGASVQQPERFLRQLFGENNGRLAYLYDTIAQLDEPQASFALGRWISDPAARLVRFTALASICIHGYPEWDLETLPFSKPQHDLGIMLLRMKVEPSGAPVSPATASFWAAVFATDDLPADDETALQETVRDDIIDAAWLADASGTGELFTRGERLDQFAFGQRVFAMVPEREWDDALVAIRAFPRQRMLMLTLERLGVRSPSTYAAAARQVGQHVSTDPRRAIWALAQLQGTLALISRMSRVGAIDLRTFERLVLSVSAVPLNEDERYAGGLAQWMETDLVPRLPPAEPEGGIEGRLISALAGPGGAEGAPRVSWEGQDYRLDPAFAERHRLRVVRQRQGGYSVDVALRLNRLARGLAASGSPDERLRFAEEALTAVRAAFAPRLKRPAGDLRPDLDLPRDVREEVERLLEELPRTIGGRDARRAARLGPAMSQLVDFALSDALLSLAYAVDIGDPDGSALLASNVALRHDFGFRYRDSDLRRRSTWAVPRQDFLPGVPWHVTGSALGLDLALSSLGLRRLSMGRPADAPRLPSTEREAFSVSAALINPRRLRDKDRDAIAAAITGGRKRVMALVNGGERLEAVADAVELDGWRRRAIRWMLDNEPEAVLPSFSLVEFLILGGGAPGADLDAWGMSALHLTGCVCTRLVGPKSWRLLSGRPQIALVAASMADLNLHVAVTLSELGLPAALMPSVLVAAVQDFIDEVSPTDPNDWWSLSRAARSISRARIEDYVAAAAAVGGPLVPDVIVPREP